MRSVQHETHDDLHVRSGRDKNPLSDEQMLQVVDEVISASKHAATEDIKLRHMFTVWGLHT